MSKPHDKSKTEYWDVLDADRNPTGRFLLIGYYNR